MTEKKDYIITAVIVAIVLGAVIAMQPKPKIQTCIGVQSTNRAELIEYLAEFCTITHKDSYCLTVTLSCPACFNVTRKYKTLADIPNTSVKISDNCWIIKYTDEEALSQKKDCDRGLSLPHHLLKS